MKKIYIGGVGACDAHLENEIIGVLIKNCNDITLAASISEADLIILTNTCIGTCNSLDKVIKMIDLVNKNKKEEAKLVVSGCIAKGLKIDLTNEQKDILSKAIIIKPDKIIEYFAQEIGEEMHEEQLEIKMPYSAEFNRIRTSITEGCQNSCSFCKINYMNFNLHSIPIETLKLFKTTVEKQPIENYFLTLFSSNLSLYGVDLYSSQRAHEAINLLTSAKNVQWAYVGALINFYPELVREIINNQKIKNIFISLESGSKRVYDLMNRPISLEKLTDIIKNIKNERPDIIIESELICGFPTETIDDFKRSLSLVEELDIYPRFLHPYDDSPFVPSHNYDQKSYDYNYALMLYGKEKLKKICSDFENKIENNERVVLSKHDEYNCCRTLLTNGKVRIVSYDQLDRPYEQGEIILPNTIKPKQLAKRFNN